MAFAITIFCCTHLYSKFRQTFTTMLDVKNMRTKALRAGRNSKKCLTSSTQYTTLTDELTDVENGRSTSRLYATHCTVKSSANVSNRRFEDVDLRTFEKFVR